MIDNKILHKAWSRLMCYQTDFALPLELSFYYALPQWLSARSVVDLGSGNGYYLSKLAERFPDKSYTAVEKEPFYVELAKKQFYSLARPSPIQIHCNDLFELSGEYDFAIARLLVQHLDSADKFLSHIQANVLRPGGSLLVIDSNDSARRFVPELPLLHRFFDLLRQAYDKEGRSRDAGLNLAALALARGFEPIKDAALLIPSTLPEYKELFYYSYLTVFEVVKQLYTLDVDYGAMRSELQQWFEMPNSYTQIGIYLLCLRRR